MNNKLNDLTPSVIHIIIFSIIAFVGINYLVLDNTAIADYRAASGGVLILAGSYLLFIAIYSKKKRSGLMALNRFVLFLTIIALIISVYNGVETYLHINQWYSPNEEAVFAQAWLLSFFTVYGIQKSINYKNNHSGYFAHLNVTRLFGMFKPVLLLNALPPVIFTIGYLIFMFSIIDENGFFRGPDYILLVYLIVTLSVLFTGYLFLLAASKNQFDMFVSFVMLLCIILISVSQIFIVKDSIDKTWFIGSIQAIIMLIITSRYLMLKGRLLKRTPQQPEADIKT